MGGHGVDVGVPILQPLIEQGGPAGRAVGHHEPDIGSLGHLGLDPVQEWCIDDRHHGVRVVEEIAEVGGPGEETHRDRDGPDTHGAQKGGREGRGVVEDQEHPLLTMDPEISEA